MNQVIREALLGVEACLDGDCSHDLQSQCDQYRRDGVRAALAALPDVERVREDLRETTHLLRCLVAGSIERDSEQIDSVADEAERWLTRRATLSPAEPAAHKESAKELAARLGFHPLTPEQERENFDANLSEPAARKFSELRDQPVLSATKTADGFRVVPAAPSGSEPDWKAVASLMANSLQAAFVGAGRTDARERAREALADAISLCGPDDEPTPPPEAAVMEHPQHGYSRWCQCRFCTAWPDAMRAELAKVREELAEWKRAALGNSEVLNLAGDACDEAARKADAANAELATLRAKLEAVTNVAKMGENHWRPLYEEARAKLEEAERKRLQYDSDAMNLAADNEKRWLNEKARADAAEKALAQVRVEASYADRCKAEAEQERDDAEQRISEAVEKAARMVEDADDGVPLQCLADAIREQCLTADPKGGA